MTNHDPEYEMQERPSFIGLVLCLAVFWIIVLICKIAEALRGEKK